MRGTGTERVLQVSPGAEAESRGEARVSGNSGSHVPDCRWHLRELLNETSELAGLLPMRRTYALFVSFERLLKSSPEFTN